MRRPDRLFAAPLAVAITALALAGCGSSSHSSAPSTTSGNAPGSTAGPAVKLNVGVGAGVYAAPLTTSAFKDAGFQITQQTLTSGAAALPLLLNGQMQFAEGDSVGALTGIAAGAPLVIVGAVTSSGSTAGTDNTNVLVKPGSSIRSAADLAGKKVAVNAIGGSAQLSTEVSINKLGGDASKVNFVELPPNAIVPAVQNGTVDAGVISAIDPQAVGLRSLLSPMSTGLPGVPLIIWVTTASYLAQHRAIVQRFAAATAKANTYLSAHPSVVRQATIATSPVKLTPAQAATVILPQFVPVTVQEPALQKVVNVMIQFKVIKSAIDLNRALFTP